MQFGHAPRVSDILAFESIAHSNMPRTHKSKFMRAFDNLMGRHSTTTQSLRHAQSHTAATLQGGVIGLALGGVLGLAHSRMKTGLDMSVGPFTIPGDGVVGALGLLASLAGSTKGRDAMTSSFSVLSFRKTMDLDADIKAKSGGKPNGTVGVAKAAAVHGDFGEDPILAAARAL